MRTRELPDHVSFVTIIVLLAIGAGALAANAGSSPLLALLVGTATGTLGWWAVSTEP
jgi:hypothetical protein